MAAASFLFGCSHHAPAPVYDASASQFRQVSQSHKSNTQSLNSIYIVKPGDTLFSIAWQYALDYHQLAKINQLSSNIIYPGQKLKLYNKTNGSYFSAESLLMALNREVLGETDKQNKIKGKTRRNQIKKITNKKTTNRVATKSRTQHRYKTASLDRKKQNSKNRFNWIWPANGNILARFSTKSNASRGLDIAGKKGQPVRATAPGQVVYEGSGLRGYGNLVIIKHDNNYLSAYAHNEKVHVSENEVVKAGQRIADIGSSGANRDKLHFEIRYKGKPVDPLNYLPEKK